MLPPTLQPTEFEPEPGAETVFLPEISEKSSVETAETPTQQHNQQRRQKKRQQVLKTRFRGAWRFLFTLVCFGLYYGLYYVHTQTRFFQYPLKPLPEVQFHHIPSYLYPEVVRPALLLSLKSGLKGNKPGPDVFQINPAQLSRSLIQQFPILDQVAIRRQLFPTRLNIAFTEKLPWAGVFSSASQPYPYALMVNTHHQNVEILPWSLKQVVHADVADTALPSVVIAPELAEIWRHQPTFLLEVGRFYRVMQLLQSLPGLTLLRVSFVQPQEQNGRVTLIATFQEFNVLLGQLDSGMMTRVSQLAPLIPKLMSMQKEISAVDLRWQNQISLQIKHL